MGIQGRNALATSPYTYRYRDPGRTLDLEHEHDNEQHGIRKLRKVHRAARRAGGANHFAEFNSAIPGAANDGFNPLARILRWGGQSASIEMEIKIISPSHNPRQDGQLKVIKPSSRRWRNNPGGDNH
jgi:hypothetical protein